MFSRKSSIFSAESNHPWVDPWGTYMNRGGMVQFWFWYFFFFSPWGRELRFGNDLSWLEEHGRPLFPITRYFWTSIKCSGAVSLMFSEDILRALTQCVINVDVNVATSLNAQCSTAASISKPRQFLESLDVWKQMSYSLRKIQWEMSGKLDANFRLPGT